MVTSGHLALLMSAEPPLHIAHVKYMKAEQLKIMCNRRMASADYAR